MNKLLFLTDFSDASSNARTLAKELALRLNAHVVVTHFMATAEEYVNLSMSATSDPTLPGMDPELVMNTIKELRDNADERMAEIVSDFKSSGVNVSSIISDDSLRDDLNDIISNEGAKMVIMGTHGARGMKEAFIGSNAQRIVRTANVPVVTVNYKCENFSLDKLVYASDFLEEKVNEKLSTVKEIKQLLEAELDILYINTPSYFEESSSTMTRMGDVLGSAGLEEKNRIIYNAFSIEQGIVNYRELSEANGIIMVTHGYKGFKKLINDNVTETVVNRANVPVISLHLNK